ncbi:IS110 family transposase [Patescibacteria group bacterium]
MKSYQYYLGIDLHKRYSQVCAVNGSGKVIENTKLENRDKILFPFFSQYQGQSQAVVEAIGFNGWLIEILERKFKIPTVIANPVKVKAIASAKIKTDRIDSETLAQLLRGDLIPSVYRPVPRDQKLKDLLRYRFRLVRYQTSLKNTIHTLLRIERVDHSFSDLFGKKGKKFIRELKLPTDKEEMLKTYLGLLESIQVKVKGLNERVTQIAKDDKRAERLTHVPGIGYLTALIIASEVGDIHRFPSAKHLTAYAGLVPSTHSSGGTTYHGRITKTGSKMLRWSLVEAAHRTVNSSTCSPRLRKWFDQVCKRGGKKKAIVALARKLLTLSYYLWKKKEEYLSNYPKAGKPVVRTGDKSVPRDVD